MLLQQEGPSQAMQACAAVLCMLALNGACRESKVSQSAREMSSLLPSKIQSLSGEGASGQHKIVAAAAVRLPHTAIPGTKCPSPILLLRSSDWQSISAAAVPLNKESLPLGPPLRSSCLVPLKRVQECRHLGLIIGDALQRGLPFAPLLCGEQLADSRVQHLQACNRQYVKALLCWEKAV